MSPNKKYLHFYILKSGLKDGQDTLDVVHDNLSYREALKCYKQLRLEIEATAKDYVHIILMGVIDKDNEVVIKAKEIAPNNELIESDINPKEEIESLKEDSKDENTSEYTGGELLTYTIEDIDFIAQDKLSALQENTNEENIDEDCTKEDCIEEEDKIEFSDYVDELTKSIKEIDDLCNKPNDNLTNTLEVQEFTENNSEYDIKKTLKSINLKEYYRHISEIDSADIIKLLVDTFKLLDEKHNYNSDMITLLTKKRDCYCHDFENLDKMNFQSLDERNDFVLSLGANMHKTGIERRKFKNEYSMTEKAFRNLPKIRPSYYKPLIEIEKSLPEFDMEKTLNVKTYIYNYSTDIEKEALLIELNKKFDKVVDTEWGTFECYNKTGSAINKKLKKELISKITDSVGAEATKEMNIVGSKDKLDIIDEVSAKKYEVIVNQTVACGSSFLKTKGSSVKITNVNEKAVNHLTRTIHHKYSKCAYDLKTRSLYLIKRL